MRAAPVTTAEIESDRKLRFAAAATVGKKATTWPKALRAMASYGIGVDASGNLVDQWSGTGAWGVVLWP